MIEMVAKPGRPNYMPAVDCDTCGMDISKHSQVYELRIVRSKLIRRWYFCSLKCLKGWADPMR